MSVNNEEYDDLSLEPDVNLSEDKVLGQNTLDKEGAALFDPDINELIENYSLSDGGLSDREDEELLPERGRTR
jgi:hypothetical protein